MAEKRRNYPSPDEVRAALAPPCDVLDPIEFKKALQEGKFGRRLRTRDTLLTPLERGFKREGKLIIVPASVWRRHTIF